MTTLKRKNRKSKNRKSKIRKTKYTKLRKTFRRNNKKARKSKSRKNKRNMRGGIGLGPSDGDDAYTFWHYDCDKGRVADEGYDDCMIRAFNKEKTEWEKLLEKIEGLETWPEKERHPDRSSYKHLLQVAIGDLSSWTGKEGWNEKLDRSLLYRLKKEYNRHFPENAYNLDEFNLPPREYGKDEKNWWAWYSNLKVEEEKEEKRREEEQLEKYVSPLLRKVGMSLEQVKIAPSLEWKSKGINDSDCNMIASLIASGALDQLKELNLRSNKIGDKGLSSFSSAPRALSKLKELVALNLGANQIGDEGAKVLSKMELPKNFKYLYLGSNQIGEEAKNTLKEAFPNKVAF